MCTQIHTYTCRGTHTCKCTPARAHTHILTYFSPLLTPVVPCLSWTLNQKSQLRADAEDPLECCGTDPGSRA